MAIKWKESAWTPGYAIVESIQQSRTIYTLRTNGDKWAITRNVDFNPTIFLCVGDKEDVYDAWDRMRESSKQNGTTISIPKQAQS